MHWCGCNNSQRLRLKKGVERQPWLHPGTPQSSPPQRQFSFPPKRQHIYHLKLGTKRPNAVLFLKYYLHVGYNGICHNSSTWAVEAGVQCHPWQCSEFKTSWCYTRLGLKKERVVGRKKGRGRARKRDGRKEMN